ncbi:MAG: sulfite exporter TauE/SafE family protein [Deltaproteobacteria bacterium]|nr:sulfite exporter TauE/SafE family protein [Deltaproteobacteria bacterium]
MIEPQTFAVIIIIFVASFVGSTFGFGFGIIAMPLLAMFIDIKTAAPLISMTGLLICIYNLLLSREKISFSNVWRLVIACAVGVPIGLYMLNGVPDSYLKVVLAVIIILFAIYSLMGGIRSTMHAVWPAFGFGLVAGIINGACNMGGPPVIIYGALKRWPPATFRTTLFSFFLPSSIMVIIGQASTGLITPTVMGFFLPVLPLLVLSLVISANLAQRIPVERFNRSIHFALLFLGTSLFVKETLTIINSYS